jgi:large subunit ribosomal protein L24
MNKIRKGDQVEVISGREDDKGKRGEVIKVVPETGTITVQGVSLRTKHQKQVQAQGRTVKPGLL